MASQWSAERLVDVHDMASPPSPGTLPPPRLFGVQTAAARTQEAEAACCEREPEPLADARHQAALGEVAAWRPSAVTAVGGDVGIGIVFHGRTCLPMFHRLPKTSAGAAGWLGSGFLVNVTADEIRPVNSSPGRALSSLATSGSAHQAPRALRTPLAQGNASPPNRVYGDVALHDIRAAGERPCLFYGVAASLDGIGMDRDGGGRCGADDDERCEAVQFFLLARSLTKQRMAHE